jgi:hypothetical protein
MDVLETTTKRPTRTSKIHEDCRETPPPSKKRGRSQKSNGESSGSNLHASPAESGEGRSKRRREAVNRFTIGHPANDDGDDLIDDDQEEEQAEDHNLDFCYKCGEGGELICCDGCPNAVHKQCAGMKRVPKGTWFCEGCRANSENPTVITATPGPGVGDTTEAPSLAKAAAAKAATVAAEVVHGIYINARPDDSLGALPFQSQMAAAERYALHCDFVADIWTQARSAGRSSRPVSFVAECSRLKAEFAQLNEENRTLEIRIHEML